MPNTVPPSDNKPKPLDAMMRAIAKTIAQYTGCDVESVVIDADLRPKDAFERLGKANPDAFGAEWDADAGAMRMNISAELDDPETGAMCILFLG
jgi:hypothetical protein